MDDIEDISRKSSSSSGNKNGFFQHVFNFDDDAKEDMLNIVQYALLAIIPVVALNKAMQRFVPEADDEKSSIELLAEVIIQIVLLFIGILFIHRLVTFVPTYSGAKYAELKVTSIVLAVLVIVLSLQTKLGEKVSILFDRVAELWNGGSTEKAKNKRKNGTNNNNNNASAMTLMASSPPSSGPSSSSSTSISQLPMQQAQMPDYNAGPQQSLPSQYESFEPMAANAALGGSSFGGANW